MEYRLIDGTALDYREDAAESVFYLSKYRGINSVLILKNQKFWKIFEDRDGPTMAFVVEGFDIDKDKYIAGKYVGSNKNYHIFLCEENNSRFYIVCNIDLNRNKFIGMREIVFKWHGCEIDNTVFIGNIENFVSSNGYSVIYGSLHNNVKQYHLYKNDTKIASFSCCEILYDILEMPDIEKNIEYIKLLYSVWEKGFASRVFGNNCSIDITTILNGRYNALGYSWDHVRDMIEKSLNRLYMVSIEQKSLPVIQIERALKLTPCATDNLWKSKFSSIKIKISNSKIDILFLCCHSHHVSIKGDDMDFFGWRYCCSHILEFGKFCDRYPLWFVQDEKSVEMWAKFLSCADKIERFTENL